MWIWQQKNWPNFTWDKSVIEPMLREARLNQGILLGKMASQSHDKKRNILDTLLANIVNSSAIEGEKLNAFSVRSSLANKLGLAEENTFPTTEQTDGIAEILIDAIENLDSMLSLKRILNWREKLFPKGYVMLSPIMGGKLRAIQSQGKKPMQVVSYRSI